MEARITLRSEETIPSFCGGQRLRYVSRVTVTRVFVLSAHVVGELRPLRVARQVPTCGADAPAVPRETHRHRIVGADVHARLPVCRVERIHRRVPVVQQTVVHRRIRGGIVVVPESLFARVGGMSASGRYEVRARARRGGRPQVVPHPALLADLHRGIHVALVVGHRRGAWAGLCITCGDTAETHFRAVGGASRRGHERTVGVAGAGGKAREVVGHRLARGVHRHVSTARSGFPLETLCDNSHVGGVGYITVQRGGGGGDVGGGRCGDGRLHVGCAAASFIAEAADRIYVAIAGEGPVHASGGVVQHADPRAARTALRGGPEVGVVACVFAVPEIHVAGGNGTKARSIVVGVCCVAWSTCCR